MNKINFIFLISSIAAESFQNIIFQSIRQPEDSFFSRIDENFQNVTNKLFSILKLDKNFTDIKKIKLLLAMHNNLSSMAESNFKIYKDLEKANKVVYDNKTINALFNLTKVIEEIFKEKDLFHTHTQRELKPLSLSPLSKNQSADYLRFNNDFLAQTNQFKSSNHSYFKRSNTVVTSGRNFRRKSHNLKAWDPSNSSELFGNETALTRRIYRGKKAKIKKFAFMVSIHMMGDFTCAGSIISSDLVITAASCLQLAYSDNFQVKEHPVTIRVGSDYTKKSGEEISIGEIYFHPQYDPVHLKNNLAIARMEKHLNFKKKKRKIRRIRYDTADKQLPGGSTVVMLGWGDRDTSQSYNGPLTITHLDVYDLAACKDIYSKSYVSDTNFCAGFIDKGSGACNRDVGGPGIFERYLAGVVSFGPPVCGTPDAPTVFTKLGFYSEWIEDIMLKKPSRTPTNLLNFGQKQANMPYTQAQRTEDNQALMSFTNVLRMRDMPLVTPNPNNMIQIEKNNQSPEVNLLNVFKNQAFIPNASIREAKNNQINPFASLLQPRPNEAMVPSMVQNQALIKDSEEEKLSSKQELLYNPLKLGQTTIKTNIFRMGRIHVTTPKSYAQRTQISQLNQDKNEQQIQMLKKLFKDLILTGNVDITDIIYPNSDEDKDFFASTKGNAATHPLINDSLFFIPGVYVTDETTFRTTFRLRNLTLPPYLDRGFLEEIKKAMDKIEPILAKPATSTHFRQGTTPLLSSREVRHTSQSFEASKLADIDSTKETEDISGNYGVNNNNYMLDDDTKEGLTIEVTTARISVLSSIENMPRRNGIEKRRITAKPGHHRYNLVHNLKQKGGNESLREDNGVTNATLEVTDAGVNKVSEKNYPVEVMTPAPDKKLRERDLNNYDMIDSSKEGSQEPSPRSVLEYVNI